MCALTHKTGFSPLSRRTSPTTPSWFTKDIYIKTGASQTEQSDRHEGVPPPKKKIGLQRETAGISLSSVQLVWVSVCLLFNPSVFILKTVEIKCGPKSHMWPLSPFCAGLSANSLPTEEKMKRKNLLTAAVTTCQSRKCANTHSGRIAIRCVSAHKWEARCPLSIRGTKRVAQPHTHNTGLQLQAERNELRVKTVDGNEGSPVSLQGGMNLSLLFDRLKKTFLNFSIERHWSVCSLMNEKLPLHSNTERKPVPVVICSDTFWPQDGNISPLK